MTKSEKIIFISVALLLGVLQAQAQGVEAELYQYNYSLVHPSFAGGDGQRISALINAAKYDGAFGDGIETLALVNYENEFSRMNSGIGITGYSDRFGASAITSFGLSYNYRFAIGESLKLIPGLKVYRHTYSIDTERFRPVEPSDPFISPDLSAANWKADLGVLLKAKRFYLGVLVENLVHTNNTINALDYDGNFEKNYTTIVGASFKLSELLATDHSIYFPISDRFRRIDLNNTLIINKMFIVGASIELRNEDLLTRFNTGINVKDYFKAVFLIFSEKRDYFSNALDFRGEVYLEFKF